MSSLEIGKIETEVDPNENFVRFILAIKEGDVEMARSLLNCSKDFVNQPYREGKTALMMMSPSRYDEMLSLLIEMGADVNIQDNVGATALMYSVTLGNDMVHALIESGSLLNVQDKDGDTALTIAAEHSDERVIHTLLSSGADINISNNSHSTALMIAVRGGNKSIVKILTEFNPNLEIEDSFGSTALLIALTPGLPNQEEIIQMLLQAGARVDTENHCRSTPIMRAVGLKNENLVRTFIGYDVDLDVKCDQGCTSLIGACEDNNTSIARLLIEAGAQVNIQDNDGATPFIRASISGNEEILRLCIQKNAKLNMKDFDGFTALMHAICELHIPIVRILVEAGVDVNIRHENTSETALILAVSSGNIQILSELLECPLCWVDYQDKEGKTALTHATQNDDLGMIHALVERGADVNVIDNDFKTPLHYAVDMDQMDIIAYFLQNHADVNIRKPGEPTLLMRAIRSRNLMLISMLVYAGADVSAADSFGSTALLEAAKYIHTRDVFETLLNAGADVNHCDVLGKSALAIAVCSARIAVIDGDYIVIVPPSTDVATALLDAGADVNHSEESSGASVLMHAVSIPGNAELATLLVKAGADINSLDGKNRNTLMYAARVGNPDIVSSLLQSSRSRLDIHVGDDFGRTLLMVAADGRFPEEDYYFPELSPSDTEYERWKVIKILADSGADVNVCDKDGASPLMRACHGGFLEIAKLLIAVGADTKRLDDDGRSALHHCFDDPDLQIRLHHLRALVSLLIHRDCDPWLPDVHGRTPWGLIESHTSSSDPRSSFSSANELSKIPLQDTIITAWKRRMAFLYSDEAIYFFRNKDVHAWRYILQYL